MLTLYEKRFGREGLEALLEELGATLQLVEEPDRWFSAERFIALNRAMVEHSQDPDMPYRAGRDIVAPATLGPLRLGLMDLVSTKQALEALPRVSKGVSRISNWEVEILGEGLARATFRPDSPAKDDRTFCRNRHGTLESLPEVVGLPMADVTHPICFFEGGAACVYDLEWSDPPQLGPRYWGAVVVLTTLGIAGVAFGSMLGAAALGLAVGVAFAAVTRKTVNNQERQQDAWDTEKLIESNERRVRELSATQQVSDAIRGSLDPQTLVEQVLASLRASLDYDRALYLAVDGDQLVATSGVGFTVSGAGQADIRISMEPKGGDDRLFANIVKKGTPLLITDVSEYAEKLLPENAARLAAIGTKGFIAAPVSWRGERHGLLLVDRREAERKLDARDLDLVGAVASSLGAGLSSAHLYDQARETLLINQKFRQYLPRSVVDEVQADPEAALQLGGKTIQAAIVFCDIAKFTSMSARSTPEQVIQALNAWFGLTDPTIAAHAGIIDKRIGDAILIVFLHNDGDDHPVARAVASAEEMQGLLRREGVKISEAAASFAGMQVRHAIHYGEVIAGNLGSLERMEYTILGDAVNVCARLEERTPAGEIWLTGEALKAMGTDAPERYRERETTTLRGRDTMTSAYKVETLDVDLPAAHGDDRDE
jgi:class 3 adenylate cyclase